MDYQKPIIIIIRLLIKKYSGIYFYYCIFYEIHLDRNKTFSENIHSGEFYENTFYTAAAYRSWI